MDMHLMNMPLSRASLVDLSRGHASASAPKPVSSVSVQEPVSSSPAPEPPSPTPVPRCSKLTLSIPGQYVVPDVLDCAIDSTIELARSVEGRKEP
jgi:hypothetical protein